jgi:hypothetical protein
MVKIIRYDYATIILYNLCIETPFEENWLIAKDEDPEDEGVMDDGLNMEINPNETQWRASVHNYLYR